MTPEKEPRSAESRPFRGVLFDTNRTYIAGGALDMLRGEKVSAYGGAVRELDCFAAGDVVFYYVSGQGVVAAGRVRPGPVCQGEFQGEQEDWLPVELLVPEQLPQREEDLQAVPAARLKQLLGHGFYYASTVKRPYLKEGECSLLLEELMQRYGAGAIKG